MCAEWSQPEFALPELAVDDSAVHRAQLHLALASVEYTSGHPSRSVEAAEAVLAEPGLPAQMYAAADQSRLLGLIALEDSSGVSWRGDDRTPAGLLALAVLAWRQGRVSDTLDRLRGATRADEECGDGGGSCYPGLGLAAVLGALGEFDVANAFATDAADAIAVRNDVLWTAVPPMFVARVALAAGRLEAAEAAAQAGLELTIQLHTPLLAPLAHDVLIAAALSKGRLPEAVDQLARWRPESAAGRLPFANHRREWAELRVLEAQSGSIWADGSTGSAFDLLATDHRLLLEEPAAAAWLVRAARGVGAETRACAVVDTIERLAVVNAGYPTVVAAAAHARGLMDGDRERLIEAASGHRSPWARASAAEDIGVLSARCCDRVGARSSFEQAAVEYGSLGAARDHARIRARLRRLGVRRRHWDCETRPVFGWASLTSTELSVASLVAEGLSNQQVGTRMFLSRHTVDFHLRQIFRKLGINSRVVLTRMTLTRETVSS
jgi:DNA-binding CsgD family transcriptional regulator